MDVITGRFQLYHCELLRSFSLKIKLILLLLPIFFYSANYEFFYHHQLFTVQNGQNSKSLYNLRRDLAEKIFIAFFKMSTTGPFHHTYFPSTIYVHSPDEVLCI